MNKDTTGLDRRSFLKASLMSGEGLMLTVSWLSSFKSAEKSEVLNLPEQWATLNGYIHILPDNKVKLICPNPEFGQNVMTSNTCSLPSRSLTLWPTCLKLDRSESFSSNGVVTSPPMESVAVFWASNDNVTPKNGNRTAMQRLEILGLYIFQGFRTRWGLENAGFKIKEESVSIPRNAARSAFSFFVSLLVPEQSA